MSSARREVSRNVTLLAVGRGWKFSRTAGFGDRDSPCITYLVSQKIPGARQPWWARESIVVRHGRSRVRVQTDVVDFGGRTVEHAAPDLTFGSGGLFVRGSPAMVVTDGASDYLLTAGHVLCRRRSFDGLDMTADPREAPPADAEIDGVPIGTALYDCSYVFGAAGRLDVGVIRLARRGLPAGMQRPPWTTLTSVAGRGNARLEQAFSGARPACSVHATRIGTDAVDLLSHFKDSTESVTERQSYAPETVVYRTRNVPLRHGDSGGLVMTDDGCAVALHFLGLDVAADPSAPTQKGFGLCLHSALSWIERHLRQHGSPGATLSLVTA